MNKTRTLLAASLFLPACHFGLTAMDASALQTAETTAAEAYAAAGPQTAAGALDRATFCAIDGVLRRNDAGPIDAGIGCASSPENGK